MSTPTPARITTVDLHEAHDDLPSPSDAADWHRRLCLVGDRIVLSGDLPAYEPEARAAIVEWIRAGITGIVDCRGEHSDQDLVAEVARSLGYVHVGIDDDGGPRPDWWFDTGVDGAVDLLTGTSGRILVHCHMGINRGPSMAYAILLWLGWHHLEALDAIRAARPISAVLYAEDAVEWWARRSARSETEALRMRREVRGWLHDHDIDAATAIRQIRNAS